MPFKNGEYAEVLLKSLITLRVTNNSNKIVVVIAAFRKLK